MTSILDHLTRRVPILTLRVVLVATFAMLLLFQAMSLPGQFLHDARSGSEHPHLAWVALAVSELLVACAQVVLVGVWALLGRVRDDTIFSDTSLTWVDMIVWAVFTGWLILFGASAYLAFWFDDPSQPLILGMGLLFGAVFALLLVVLRALLRQATSLRTDMDAVI